MLLQDQEWQYAKNRKNQVINNDATEVVKHIFLMKFQANSANKITKN